MIDFNLNYKFGNNYGGGGSPLRDSNGNLI